MISINYENKEYILGDYILTNALVYSKGCRGSRDLIKKKILIVINIFLHVKKKMNGW